MGPLILKSKEGKEYDIGTMVYRIKLRGSDTGNLFTLLDFTVYPGAIGPGKHFTDKCSKTFFVLSGKLKFFFEEDEREVIAGDTIFVPKKMVHDFANPYDHPCRFLLQMSPAGLENFYEEASLSNPHEYKDLLKQYHIEMV